MLETENTACFLFSMNRTKMALRTVICFANTQCTEAGTHVTWFTLKTEAKIC